jgi:glycosyltransferase involved in cell wall biosynthesis
LELVRERTLQRKALTVSVVIPAHNEQETIAGVITDAHRSLDILGVDGEVLVVASGCTDRTVQFAAAAGARVAETGIGKGRAVAAGVAESTGEVVCLVDGDMRYFGDTQLVVLLVDPILRGCADASIADLYWRPVYPQLWLNGFFAPLAGALFPELLAKVGSTPWSGQRAALRRLWPETLPEDFTVDLAILLHWNRVATRLRPVLADDWTNPQRPKPDLMKREFWLLVNEATAAGRIGSEAVPKLASWLDSVHSLMAEYRPHVDNPVVFERALLKMSLATLQCVLLGQAA